MMEMLNIKRGPRRPKDAERKKAMKNITRTIRILNVEYPVKTENGFETRTANVIDKGAAAVRAELKEKCASENVKFLGEYDIIGVDENLFSMDIETFVRYAQTVR